MVIKTELCAFSEMKVYPGHGRRFVTRSGQLVVLGGSKVDSMYHQRKKNAKLMWTQTWRRMHKKVNVDNVAKRRARRVVKVMRAPAGISAADFEARVKKAAAPAAPRAPGAKSEVLLQASVKEAKEKKKAMIAARKKAAGGAKVMSGANAKHAAKGR